MKKVLFAIVLSILAFVACRETTGTANVVTEDSTRTSVDTLYVSVDTVTVDTLK